MVPLLAYVGTLIPVVLAGEFTDDKGVKHTWTAAKPKICAHAFEALGLIQFGLQADQLHCTFGERTNPGSNFGGVFDPLELQGWSSSTDHTAAAFDPAKFPQHPSTDEKAILDAALDLSPSCSGGNVWCGTTDFGLLDTTSTSASPPGGWPDIFIQGTYDAGWGYPDDVRASMATKGIPLIVMGASHDHGDKLGAPGDGTGTMIETVKRYEQLAIALGVADVATTVAPQKTALCTAVTKFKATAAAAATRGVRALVISAPSGPNGPAGASGKEGIGAYLYSPYHGTLKMLEELGMQILHISDFRTCASGSPGCSRYEGLGGAPIATTYREGPYLYHDDLRAADGTPLHVDFFLFDYRKVLDFTGDEFAEEWPHAAIKEKQYAFYFHQGPHSYQFAATVLNEVEAKLKTAKRVSPATDCTAVPHVSAGYRQVGLCTGEYACHHTVSYDCDTWAVTTDPNAPDSSAYDSSATCSPADGTSGCRTVEGCVCFNESVPITSEQCQTMIDIGTGYVYSTKCAGLCTDALTTSAPASDPDSLGAGAAFLSVLLLLS